MRRIAATLVFALMVMGAAHAAHAQVGKPVTITDANMIAEADLAKLPHMNAMLAKTLLAKRPFKTSKDLDTALSAAGLTKEQRTELYAKLFVPINLNAATDEEKEGDTRIMPHPVEDERDEAEGKRDAQR